MLKEYKPNGSLRFGTWSGSRSSSSSSGGLLGRRRGTWDGEGGGLQVLVGTGGAREHEQRKILKERGRSHADFAWVTGVTGPGGLATAGPATPVNVQQGRQFAAPSGAASAPTVAARPAGARGLRLRVNLVGYALSLPFVPDVEKMNLEFNCWPSELRVKITNKNLAHAKNWWNARWIIRAALSCLFQILVDETISNSLRVGNCFLNLMSICSCSFLKSSDSSTCPRTCFTSACKISRQWILLPFAIGRLKLTNATTLGFDIPRGGSRLAMKSLSWENLMNCVACGSYLNVIVRSILIVEL